MPLTPFHLGPALLVGVAFHRRLDLPTLLAGSVLIDVRAALVVFDVIEGPTHGVFTTFAGAGAVAVVLAGATFGLPGRARDALDHARLADTDRALAILAAAFVGTFSHVVLDAVLYADVQPLYPLVGNPLLVDSVLAVPLVYGGCAFAGAVAVPVGAVRWMASHRE